MANLFSVGLLLLVGLALTSAANEEAHLRNILDALIGSGDYGGWANVLSSGNPSELPLTATLFIPSNEAISGLLSGGLDPLLVPYHIVPQRLTFSDLQDLTPRTRLPTLLPANFILLTSNSPLNLTIDGAHITQPDIFLNAAFALHGVDRVLNYSLFGHASPLPPPPATLLKPRGIIIAASSRSCATVPIILPFFFHLLHLQYSSTF